MPAQTIDKRGLPTRRGTSKKWQRPKAPPSLGRKRPRSSAPKRRCELDKTLTIYFAQAFLCSAAFPSVYDISTDAAARRSTPAAKIAIFTFLPEPLAVSFAPHYVDLSSLMNSRSHLTLQTLEVQNH
jgi:hypothetical protein